MDITACLSSKTDNWATPQDFYGKLNEEFHFTLDPCSSDENHKCEKYFTKEQDGLSQNWADCPKTQNEFGESTICRVRRKRETPDIVCKREEKRVFGRPVGGVLSIL